MNRSGFSQLAVVVTAMVSHAAARADTSPQELLAMVPADASIVVLIPNLKYCSDEFTRCLEGMDRANLLLGTRPLDQLKSFTGFNVGINDVGGAAMIAMESTGDAPLKWTYVIPVSDGAGFLSGNFKSQVKDDEYLSAGGRTYHAKLVGAHAVVSEQAKATAAVSATVANAPEQSVFQNLGDAAAKLMADGEVIIAASRNGASRMFDHAAAANPLAGDEQAVARIRELAAPFVDQLSVTIVAVNFDPLGVITRTLSIYNPDSQMARQLVGGKSQDATPLSRLPNKPAYLAASIDVQGLGGANAMNQLCSMLGIPAPPQWLTQARRFQFAAYPSPAGLAGGLLNDAVLVMETASTQQARDAVKSALTTLNERMPGVKTETVWVEDQPVKNATSPISADQYEVRLINVAPEHAMVQSAMPIIVGRGGWRGFVKPTSDALVMTFSQRPAVLEAALNVKPESSYGSNGVIRTMHKWMPEQNDIEVYLGVAQLAQMARQIAGSIGMDEMAGMPEFEANTPPIGFAAEVDEGTIGSTTVVPAAILAPLVDSWIGMMRNPGIGDDAPASPPPQSSPASGAKP